MQAEILSDQELIRRIQQGDQAMLERLVERYYDDIFGFCYYKIGELIKMMGKNGKKENVQWNYNS